MTKLLLKLSGVALALTLMIATGCEDDSVTDPLGPSLTLADDTGFIAEDTTFTTDVTSFSVRLQANVGDNPLTSLVFLVDGVQVGAAEIGDYILSITTNATTITTINNPQAISSANENGGVFDIEISTARQAEDVPTEYSFQIVDEVGETSSMPGVSITLSDPGTPIDRELTGVLFNQAGDAGFGALDLDEGYRTGVTTDGPQAVPADAEIRDLGLDCTVPAPGFNWRRQIGTMNGADMVAVDASQIENFTFDNVRNKEEIAAAYDTGITLSNGEAVSCSSGNTTPVTDVSDEVAVGDMFVVLSGGVYYLIRIDAVSETGSDNLDNYELSIKY